MESKNNSKKKDKFWSKKKKLIFFSSFAFIFFILGAMYMMTDGEFTYQAGLEKLFSSDNFISASTDANWSRKAELTIDHTLVDADLTDFPVLLTNANLPNEMWNSSSDYHALSTGCDIRFTTDSNGTNEIPFEIVNWTLDSATASEIWVKLNLTSETDTTFWVWYNNDLIECYSNNATYGSENVWNNNYEGVWHLGSGEQVDSTGKIINGTLVGGLVTGENYGKVGESTTFDGSGEYIYFEDIEMDSWTDLTLNAWFKTSTTNVDMRIISKDRIGVPGNFMLQFNDAIPYIGLSIRDGAAWDYVKEDTNSYNNGEWHKITTTINNSNNLMKLFIDGENTANGTFDASTLDDSDNEVFTIGGASHGSAGHYWNGELDEIRLSNKTFSDGWFTTEFNNQNSSEQFITSSESQEGTIFIIITYPVAEENYNTNITTLNYTLETTKTYDVCWYSTNDGTTNSSTVEAGINFTDISDIEGNRKWTIYCNNSEGDIYKKEILYNVDLTSPTITIISPTNNQIINDTVFIWFNATADEEIDEWVFNYDGTNFSGINLSKEMNNEGIYNLTVYATDLVGNIGINDSITFNVSVEIPELVFQGQTPTDNDFGIETSFIINASVIPKYNNSFLEFNYTNVDNAEDDDYGKVYIKDSYFHNISFDYTDGITTCGYGNWFDYENNFSCTNYEDDELLFAMNFDNKSSLGENSTYFYDHSENGNNGTGEGFENDEIVNGKYTKGVYFDGINDTVIIPHSTNLEFKNNMSISLWVKLPDIEYDSDDKPVIFAKDDGTTNRDYIMYIKTDSIDELIFLKRYNGYQTTYVSAGDLNDDTWHNVIIVQNTGGLKIYVDGVSKDSESNSAPADADGSNFYIGSLNGTERFLNGTIDDLRIYNRTLDENERDKIRNIYLERNNDGNVLINLDNAINFSELNKIDINKELEVNFSKQKVGDSYIYNFSEINLNSNFSIESESNLFTFYNNSDGAYTFVNSISGLNTGEYKYDLKLYASFITKQINRSYNIILKEFTWWGGGCPHIYEDGSDQALATNIKQMDGDGGTKTRWDLLTIPGDWSGGSGIFNDGIGREIRDQYLEAGVDRNKIYAVNGNHGPGADFDTLDRWLDPMGNHTSNSGITNSERPYVVRGEYERFWWESGNILYLMMADLNRYDDPFGKFSPYTGGYPAGAISNETFNWWLDKVENNQDKIIVTVFHQGLLNGTAYSGYLEGSANSYHQNFTWHDTNGSSMLYGIGNYSIDGFHANGTLVYPEGRPWGVVKYLTENEGAIDIWAHAHTHLDPYDEFNNRTTREVNYGTNIINVGAMTHYHGEIAMPHYSTIFEFKQNSTNVTTKIYNHETGDFIDGLDKNITIKHPFDYGYRIENLSSELEAESYDYIEDYTERYKYGIKDVHIKKNNTLIGNLSVNFTQDIDWEDFVADIGIGKSIIYINKTENTEIINENYTLKIPISLGEGNVTVCPNATNLDEVSRNCINSYLISGLVEDDGYYTISLESGGASDESDETPPTIIQLNQTNSSGTINGSVTQGDNVTFTINTTDNDEVDSVWVTIWQGVIGGPIWLIQQLIDLGSGIWEGNVTINTTIPGGDTNYTIYVNDTSGNEANESGNFTVISSDTCTCPGLDTNWEINMSDYCVLSTPCDLGTGNLTFTGAGNFTCGARIDAFSRGKASSGSVFYRNGSCEVYKG